MTNSAGMLKESIWRDGHFRQLSRTAQCTYAQLLSQKDLDRAGMQPLQITKWAKGCDEMTMDDLRADLDELERERFVFYDDETDELFIRAYMRTTEVTRYPQYLKNALKCAVMVASPKLRHELAVELRRLRKPEANQVAAQIDPSDPDPDDTVPEPCANPTVTVPEGCENGSSTVNPDGTLPEPYRDRGRVGVRELTLVSTQVGERSAPPPEFCPRHPGGTDDPCRACRRHRELRAQWAADDVTLAAAAQRAQREAERDIQRHAIDACPMCDNDGYRGGRVCDHVDRSAIAKAGAARARAALAKSGDDL
nr:hypothetical protein [Mycobacteroides abscessus]